jgi:AsmA protein
MRKWWMILAGVVVGLPAIGAALLMFVDVNQFRPRIQGLLEQKLHRTVSLGAMGLKLYPLAIRIENVAIGESQKFQSESPFLSAKEFDVRIDLGALLRKQVEVDALHVLQPAVVLIRNREGKWNFSELTASRNSGGGGSTVSLESLIIQDAKISVIDQRAGGGRATYDHIDIAVNNFSPSKPYTAQLKVPVESNAKAGLGLHVNGVAGSADFDGKLTFDAVPLATLTQFLGSANGSLPALILNGDAVFSNRGDVLSLSAATIQTGGVTIKGSGEVKGDAAHFEFQTSGAQLAGLLQMAGVDSISGTGTVTMNLKVSGALKALTYAGTAALRDASIKFQSLRSPLQIQSADVRVAPDQLALAITQASIGSSRAKGTLNVREFSHPKLEFSLDVDKVDAVELEKLFEPGAGDKSKTKSASPSISGSGKVNIGKLTANQFVLTDIQSRCALEGTTIKLDPVTAKLYGGVQTGSITLSTSGEKPTYALRSNMQSVDAAQLINSMSSLKNALTGILSGESDLRILPAQDLAHGLNGTVHMQLANGKLSNVHIMNELSVVGKFLGYAKKEGNFTNIAKLAGTLKIASGVATTDDLVMEFDGGTLSAAGTFGLTDQSLKLKVTAVLGKDASQKAGGSQVGGILSTVLSNPKGELVIPAIVSGTFTSPRFAPDPERMAKIKLEGLKQMPIENILNLFRKPKDTGPKN